MASYDILKQFFSWFVFLAHVFIYVGIKSAYK